MTAEKPLENTSNDRPHCVLIALILLAAVTRVSPVFIEQIVPLVLCSLVRLRVVPVFVGQLIVAEAKQACRQIPRLTRKKELLHRCQAPCRATPAEFK
jgi:hypothetical protein